MNDAQLDRLTAGNDGPRRSFEDRLANNVGGLLDELNPIIEEQLPEGTSLPPEIQAGLDLLAELAGVGGGNGGSNGGDPNGGSNGGFPGFGDVPIGGLFPTPGFGIPN